MPGGGRSTTPRSVVRSLVSTLTTSHARRLHLIVTPPSKRSAVLRFYLVHLYLGMGALRAAESVKTEHAAEPKRAERALFAYHSGARLPTLGCGPGLGGVICPENVVGQGRRGGRVFA